MKNFMLILLLFISPLLSANSDKVGVTQLDFGTNVVDGTTSGFYYKLKANTPVSSIYFKSGAYDDKNSSKTHYSFGLYPMNCDIYVGIGVETTDDNGAIEKTSTFDLGFSKFITDSFYINVGTTYTSSDQFFSFGLGIPIEIN